MEKRLSLREQFQAFEAKSPEYTEDCYFFWDWFCNDKSLESKSKSLMPKVKKLVEKLNINIDSHYVFFKNNCPGSGNLYDSFSICELSGNRDVKVWCTPKSGHYSENGEAQVYVNKFNEPRYKASTWKELISKI
jgi:hypothetical protein